MFRSGKYKWSIVAVAILLLLAFYRNQVTEKNKVLNNHEPVIHENIGPHVAEIPQPIRSIADHFGSSNQIVQHETIQQDTVEEIQPHKADEIERFALSDDGGDFESSQFQSSQPEPPAANVDLDMPMFAEPAKVVADDNDSEINEAYASTEASQFSAVETEEQFVPSNPVLQSMQHNGQQLNVAVESVPDFEPAFARSQANGPIQLSRGVLVKVVNHIEYGKSLARRGAVYGAKQEFLSALKLVAQSIDQMRGGDMYADAYFEAVQAIRESDDFYNAQAQQHRKVDVVAIAKEHRSKVTEPSYLKGLNPMQAMQMYYDFVQDRLVACSGNTVVSGEALYCLGKLHQVNAKDPIEGSQVDNAKSVVYYNAAVNCDPKNYKSANELGVLLARSGRLVEARNLFLGSLKVHQVSKVWSNLASVHRQLGENDLAQLADTEYRRMLDGPAANRIIWVQPEVFANQSKKALATRTAAADQQIIQPQPKQKPAKGLRGMMKKLF